MALDYSKLSDDELEAIANDDYSKLSDRTLRQLTRDPTAQTVPNPEAAEISVAPQVASVAKEMAPGIAKGATAVGKMAASIPEDWMKMSKILYNNASLDTVGQAIKEPWKTATGAVEAYVAGHPVLGQITAATPKQAVGALAQGARNVGGALVQGAVAPESLMMLPYQMAAYEQDKIRANPNAPGLEYNPYAQVQRGEYATQGQAGAANQRRAVMNQPYGNVTPQEKALLDQDKQQRMRMLMQYEAARRVLGNQ